MASIVSDFIINPVLRQARRFSEISRTTFGGEDDAPTPRPGALGADDVVPEDPGLETAIDLETSSTDLPTTPDRDVTFDEIITSSPPTVPSPRDHLGFPTTPRKTGPIPEDDGMGYLRARIHSINAKELAQDEKARQIHDVLTERYRASRAVVFPGLSPEAPRQSTPSGPSSDSPAGIDPLRFWRQDEQPPLESFNLTAEDIMPTFAPIRPPKVVDGIEPTTPPPTTPPLGCQHYERNVKLQCSTCDKWYTCRFCHDAVEDHNLIRSETKHMLCMLCATPQRAGEVCVTCGEISANYYCDICKLWENRPSKPIYHCEDCGICRRGLGLGKDFFHCKVCRACITTSIETSHKCIERSTDCDCPICGDYMFTSPKPVVFMVCGHSIHKKCYDQHMKTSYKCPICNKSLVNMETQFRNLDLVILSQPMPPEFRDTKAVILCNDCSGRCTVPYHWLGLKCVICQSYNTVELQILGGLHDGQAPPGAHTERPELVPLQHPQSLDDVPPMQTTLPRGDRAGSILAGRRRHSSNGVELQPRVPERTARSLSPLSVAEMPSTHADLDGDSDNDILVFWRSGDDDSSSEDDDDDGSDNNHDSEEEDDDDEHEIMLIGHR